MKDTDTLLIKYLFVVVFLLIGVIGMLFYFCNDIEGELRVTEEENAELRDSVRIYKDMYYESID